MYIFRVCNNSVDYSLNRKKKIRFIICIYSLNRKKYIKLFAKLLGSFLATYPTVAYGSIHCKGLEKQKFLILIINVNNYEGNICINRIVRNDLNWWQYV